MRTYAVLKLAIMVAGAPIGLPVVAMVATRNTAKVRKVINAYPSLLEELVAAAGQEHAARSVAAPAAERYVITSDLHRGPLGLTDLAGLQGTAPLYAAMLDHYADAGWALVENGDVEDYWMVSGSAYAAAYDATRMLGGALSRVTGRRVLDAVYREHLERIIERHAPIYERLRDRFHAHGRYLRTIGNHDNVYNESGPRAALTRYFDGLPIVDVVLLTTGEHGAAPTAADVQGVIAHGHQTDPWNAASMDALGRLSSSFGSSLYDLPFVRLRPGIATQDDADRLLQGRAPASLMAINPVIGANLDLYSLDEVRLHQACRAGWGVDERGQTSGPVLVLGHTHAPLIDPVMPDATSSWRRYVNSGTGALPGVVTAVEWDGTANPSEPRLQLVAWRWHPDEPDRPQRLVLHRDDNSTNLQVREEVGSL